MNDELAAVWAAVADDGDLIWSPAEIQEGFFDDLVKCGLPHVRAVNNAAQIDGKIEACPWGWTDDVRKLAEQHGWWIAAPPQDVIRQVNSRRFSLELERSWGIDLEGAAVIHSVEELAGAVARLPQGADRWVLKAEFGMSARERVFGQGRDPNAQVVNWLRGRLHDGCVAVLEPWVERIEEVGIQFTVPWAGLPLLEGVTPLPADAASRYRGNRFGVDVELELRWMPAIETGMRVARLVRQLGYFGPLGIDAMRYRGFDGRERIRSVQDVNARHTMGRLALGLRRVLDSGECGSWLHVRWPMEEVHADEEFRDGAPKEKHFRDFGKSLGSASEAVQRHFEEVTRLVPTGTRVIRTSPFEVGDRPVSHGTLVVAAPSQARLEEAERILLSS